MLRNIYPLTYFALIAVGALGCSSAEDHDFNIEFEILSDADAPLGAVEIKLGGRLLGSSDANGRLNVHVKGNEGDQLRVQPSCPKGYAAENALSTLVLRKFRPMNNKTEGRHALLHSVVRCHKTEHRSVVMIRNKGVTGVPVRVRGGQLATVDVDGTSHILLQGKPGTIFRLLWDTKEFSNIRPQNPEKAVTIGAEDDIVYVEQPFAKVIKRKKIHRATPVKLPMRIE